MHIDIVSDLVCPWCYLGKKRLARALALRPETRVSLRWRAFQLNPEIPVGGLDREAYLVTKFGSVAKAARNTEALTALGKSEGIAFSFDQIRRMPNTRDAHRLMRFAAKQGKADVMAERLFHAYFAEGRDIGNRQILTDIAVALGHDGVQARRWLDSDSGLREVLEEDRNARRLGIAGVPCFIIDSGYAISGAQEPEFFLPLFDLAQNAAPQAVE